MTEILLWAGYFAVFAFLVHKGRSKDAVLSGSVGFGVQAFAYVATYISAVALVGFGGLAHAYGLQMLLVAAGNVWFGTCTASWRGQRANGRNASARAPRRSCSASATARPA